MEKTNCFFCNSISEKYTNEETDGIKYKCLYCGNYELTKEVVDDSSYKLEQNKHIFAGYLEETKRNRKEPLIITKESINIILEDSIIPKKIINKMEKLLLYCYDRNKFVGQEFATNSAYITPAIGNKRFYLNDNEKRVGIAYSSNTSELNGLIEAMSENGWISVDYSTKWHVIISFKLTGVGLSHAEQLLTTNIESNKVFVAMGFRDDYKERLEKAIKPACKDCGFDAFIVSDNEFNNSIIDEMLVGIKTSKFLITDLTYNNCGAYYEAGFAHGLSLEVIKCCSKAWFDEEDKDGNLKNKLHFDVIADNLILYENYDDLKKRLKNRIRATVDGAILEDK